MASSASCTGIILSGGLNTRMQGRNKALLRIGEQRILDRIIGTLEQCGHTCMIVTREPSLYLEWQAEIVRDVFDIRSPLTGIHAGLRTMGTEFGFVTSCDTPLLKKEVVQVLMEALNPNVDVVVPFEGTFYQPMCAIYSRRCVPVIEQMLHRHQLKVDLLYERVRLKTIPYAHFKVVDPQLNSFFNVNTPEDLETARKLVSTYESSK